ncbi:MAG: hypothetical protein ACK5KL_04890 [Dysgonomonas sp.]
MPKSRNRKIKKKTPKKKNPKPYEVIKDDFVLMENPFPEDISFEARIEVLTEIGKKASSNYELAYKELIEYFNEYDPLYLCSFCAYYFRRQREGIDEEAINGFIDFPPFHLEILQCIALMFDRCISAKPLHDEIETFKSTIKSFCTNQAHSYFKLIENAKDQTDIGAVILRSDMMGHTLAVRNWAFLKQMESVAYDLAYLIEDRFTDRIGFSPKAFLDILFCLVPIMEIKANSHLQKTRAFLKAKNYNDVFDLYEANFDVVKKDKVVRAEIWGNFGENLKQLKAMLLMHSDCRLDDIYTLSSSEISDYLLQKYSENEICNILNRLSFNFGELSDVNKDHIFLNNPIHDKPFIKVDQDKYFSSIPHMFSHLGVDLLENFISNDTKLSKEYNLKKGKYLENRVEDLFRKSFPNAQIVAGSIWKCPQTHKEFENDLIVLIDDFAMIVECKSGSISPPAKRGAPDRLFKTIQELIIAPSEQAIRFENYLRQNRKSHEFKTKSKNKNVLDNTTVKYYIPLAVTLSNLGSIGCNLKKIIEAQVTSLKFEDLAPSISITDLDVIFDILSFKAEKIHYLSRRREFTAHINFEGDEIDLFAFYLDNGFNIGETEYDKSLGINLTLKSKEIDPYYVGKERGRIVKKPCLQKTKYWNEVLMKLEKESPNWLMASYILLNLPKEDQIKFEKGLKELTNRILKGKCEKPYNYMEMHCGPERRRFLIVGFPYLNITKEIRNDVINRIVTSFDENNNIRGLLILGYDLGGFNYPYSVVAGNIKTNFFDELDIS